MMADQRFVIFLVDDDVGALTALTRLLSTKGVEVRPFSSATKFLAQHDPSLPGCAILDVSMPDLDGLEVQKSLKESGSERPIIFITGVGDIPTSVNAMKAGAIDFLTKPINSQQLLAAIALAAEKEAQAIASRVELSAVNDSISKLTRRERQVLTHVVAGRLNKQIAADLGTTEKTIKLHRGRMMRKLGIRMVADLVRIAERAGIEPSFQPDRSGSKVGFDFLAPLRLSRA